MIFMVLVGGLGTFEGPIIGAIVLFLIQNQFGARAASGTSSAWARRRSCSRCFCRAGSGGRVSDRYAIQLLPVGYLLRGVPAEPAPAEPR